MVSFPSESTLAAEGERAILETGGKHPMEPEDFTERKWGQLVKTAQGYWAFRPDNLPPDLELSWSLARTLSDADRALASLAGTARNLRNPHLLIRPFIRREAVLSSRIEGTQASLSDVFFFEAAEIPGERQKSFGDISPGELLKDPFGT